MELFSDHNHRIHCNLSLSFSFITFSYSIFKYSRLSLSLKCSFLPKFQVKVETKYENNSGETENVNYYIINLYSS